MPKNTTLIALINKLKLLHPDKKIILLEDPIEQVLPDVLQIQVDTSDKELGYSHFLRAALRHNHDILGVGETRDAESANLVLEAASVGHITFTTFHTTDSTKAIERMVSLTKDTSKLSDSLRCVISQKLVKKICTKCVREIDSKIPNIVNLDSYIAKTGWKGEFQFSRATGKLANGKECPYCSGTGAHGRIGIFEILTFSEKTKDLILKNSPAYQIRKQAIKEGLRSLFLNGLVRVLMGEVTLGELIKQTGYPNAQKEGVSFEYDSDSVNNELN
ncbi:MAG: type IV pilus assembly protein PilB [bacterium]|nr:MAG: type IV pilus assembly protein PilB [bacterium]